MSRVRGSPSQVPVIPVGMSWDFDADGVGFGRESEPDAVGNVSRFGIQPVPAQPPPLMAAARNHARMARRTIRGHRNRDIIGAPRIVEPIKSGRCNFGSTVFRNGYGVQLGV